MNNLFFLLIISMLFGHMSVANEISISFDDAPKPGGKYYTGKQRTKRITEQLAREGVKRAAFYVNTNKIFNVDSGLERLRYYKKMGHLVGNHTHSHINIRKHTVSEYIKDFNEADRILKNLGLLDPYFRYPFLRRGKTSEQVNKIHKHLRQSSYVDAFITIDNYDFYMDSIFQKVLSLNNTLNMENLRNFYVETLYKSVKFYSELAEKSLGKKVKHVMLLHENDLTALFVGDFIAYLKAKGWKIITPEESYNDPVTSRFPSHILKHGQGRVGSLALAAGYKGPISSGFENTKVLDKLFVDYNILE